MLVTNMEQGHDLAKCLGENNVARVRGHGFASAGRTLIEVVRMSVYLPPNARTLMRAKQLGGTIKYLSKGEIDARNRGYSPYSTETWQSALLPARNKVRQKNRSVNLRTPVLRRRLVDLVETLEPRVVDA